MDSAEDMVARYMQRHPEKHWNYPAERNMAQGTKVEFSPRQLERLVERYRSGESMARLAKAFGCSAPTIRDRLIKAGVDLKKRGKQQTLADLDTIYRRFLKGEEIDDIASEYGEKPLTLHTRLREAGYELDRQAIERKRAAPAGSNDVIHLPDQSTGIGAAVDQLRQLQEILAEQGVAVEGSVTVDLKFTLALGGAA